MYILLYYLVIPCLLWPDLLLVVRHLVLPVFLPHSPAVESHHQCSHHQDGAGDDDDEDQQQSRVLCNRKIFNLLLVPRDFLDSFKPQSSLLGFMKKRITLL